MQTRDKKYKISPPLMPLQQNDIGVEDCTMFIYLVLYYNKKATHKNHIIKDKKAAAITYLRSAITAI